jgi:hypothetical protein
MNEQIGARAAANDVPDSNSLSPAGLGYGPERDRPAVEFRFHCRASQTKLFICIKAQRRARNRYLEACGVLVVPKESVSKTERKRIHRPRRRYTYRPVAEPAGKILDTRLGAGLDHLKGTRMVFKSVSVGGATASLESLLGSLLSPASALLLKAKSPASIHRHHPLNSHLTFGSMPPAFRQQSIARCLAGTVTISHFP